MPVAHVDIMPTMTCGGGHAASHNQVSGQMRDAYMVPVAYAGRTANTNANGHGVASEVTHTLDGANGQAIAFPANLSATQHASTADLAPAMGAVNPTAVAYTTKLHNTGSNNAGKLFEERTTCLDANSPPPALLTAMQVRRLTPRECERLQGFPDDYTAIPWRKKTASECPDGPRYKALGNSWAVPNVRWIGRRIDNELRRLDAANDNQPAALAAIAS